MMKWIIKCTEKSNQGEKNWMHFMIANNENYSFRIFKS